ncbi:MAG: hypothetical protein ACYTG6_14110 [Planctomycetota bacterium]|jgi:hypothetical protein
MSGHGGHKHRKAQAHNKRARRLAKARADIARVKGIFEAKGQTWDPKNNPAQMAAMNHDARRLVSRSQFAET